LVIDGRVGLSGRVTNTTSGRIFKGPTLAIAGFQKVASPKECGADRSNGEVFRTPSGSVWCEVAVMGVAIAQSQSGDLVLDIGTTVGVGGELPMNTRLGGEVAEAAANAKVANILATPTVWVVFNSHLRTPYKEATQLPAKEWWFSDAWHAADDYSKSFSWILARSGTL
jgi:hypothetical protein